MIIMRSHGGYKSKTWTVTILLQHFSAKLNCFHLLLL